MSGVLLGLVNQLNLQTSTIEHEELQHFYTCLICACFSPFFILSSSSSESKSETKQQLEQYSQKDVVIGMAIVGLLISIKGVWIDRVKMKRMGGGEGGRGMGGIEAMVQIGVVVVGE